MTLTENELIFYSYWRKRQHNSNLPLKLGVLPMEAEVF